MEEVRQICDSPIQTTMGAQVGAVAPLLVKLDIAVFQAPSGSAFITSDNPCVWFDSAADERPPLYRSPGLAYPTIEITLPISPSQIILLNRMKLSGYFPASQFMVHELNRRTRFHADKYFVVDRNKINPYWFDPGIERDGALT